ncbi:MAG: hypothetical protein P1U46_03980 [Patescibacteria group bacterium]|nr:hypothetical protein [Patescibacteria group bacterium]
MFHILWSKIRKREIIDSLEYIKKFIHRISILIIVTVFIIGSLSYISNEIFPAKMPQYTITN